MRLALVVSGMAKKKKKQTDATSLLKKMEIIIASNQIINIDI